MKNSRNKLCIFGSFRHFIIAWNPSFSQETKKKLPFQFSHCSKSPFFVQKSLTFYRLGWVEFYRYQKSNSRNEFLDQNWTLEHSVFSHFMDFLTPDLLLHFSSKMESKLLANKYGNNTIIFNTTRKLSVNEIATSRNGKKNLDQRYYQFVLHFNIHMR